PSPPTPSRAGSSARAGHWSSIRWCSSGGRGTQVDVLARLLLGAEGALQRGGGRLAALRSERIEREAPVDGIVVLHHRALLQHLRVDGHAVSAECLHHVLHRLRIVAPDAIMLDRGAPHDVVLQLGLWAAIALDADGEELRVQALREAVRRFDVRFELLDLLQLARELRLRAVIVVKRVPAEGEYGDGND